MTQHATLSASGAHGWMRCYGKLALEKGYGEKSSTFADEGTAAHELASWCLESGQDASAYAGRIITVRDAVTAIVAGELVELKPASKFEVDEDMVENVQRYVDIVRGLGGDLMVEQRVDFSSWIGVPDSFGTSDAIVVLDRDLVVCDLKYGRGVQVDAEENEQLQLYALGSYSLASLAYDIDTVRMMIVQPRLNHVSEWAVSVDHLKDFAARAAIAARHAIHQYDGKAEPKLSPGEKQCRFCRAKATCPALAAEVRETVSFGVAKADDFSDLTDMNFPVMSTVPEASLAAAMSKVDLIEQWCKAVRAEVESRLVEGKPVEGYKLVQGRKGARAWVSKDEAEVVLSSLRLKKEQMYDMTVISPTTAEKLFKAGDIGPRQWPKVQALITQAEGKPSVAPAGDKRPAITVAVSADDFAVVTDAAADLA